MRQNIVPVLVGALVVSWAAAGFAQAPPQPGPEHELLKQLEGTWETVFEGQPEAKGKAVYKMELGGLWLIGNFEGSIENIKFSGHGMETYDPHKKKYISVWVDSMSTRPMILEGDYDEQTKTLTMTGEGPGMDGSPTKYKTTTYHKDKNTMVFKLFGEGDMEMFTIIYTRKQ